MSFAAGFTAGLAVGRKKGGGGGGGGGDENVGKLRAAIDNDTGRLKIVSEDDEEALSDFNFTYQYVNYEKTVPTIDKNGGELTEIFKQRIITALFDKNGKKIMRTEYNAETGEITGYFDSKGVEIHIEEWR